MCSYFRAYLFLETPVCAFFHFLFYKKVDLFLLFHFSTIDKTLFLTPKYETCNHILGQNS